MLVQAAEMNYDTVHSLVSAVGNVQIYYNGTTLEADKVTYNQKTKRIYAEGNVRITDANGGVSLTEAQVAWPDLTEEAFTAADTDGNGELSAEEYDALVAASAAPAAQ